MPYSSKQQKKYIIQIYDPSIGKILYFISLFSLFFFCTCYHINVLHIKKKRKIFIMNVKLGRTDPLIVYII